MLVGVVNAGLEAGGLLLLGDVEEEFEGEDVVVGEHGLELVDVFETATDGFGRDELVDSWGEDVLVVRPVEDLDHAAGGYLGVDAPEEVVARFDGCGDFEGGYIATLGVDSGEDVADGAVLASGIHALEDDEQGLRLAGVEEFLKAGELLTVFGENGCSGGVGVEAACFSGGETRQFDCRMWLDQVRRLQFHAVGLASMEPDDTRSERGTESPFLKHSGANQEKIPSATKVALI